LITVHGIKERLFRWFKEEPKVWDTALLLTVSFCGTWLVFGIDLSLGLVFCITSIIIASTLWVMLRSVGKGLDVLIKHQAYLNLKREAEA